MSGARKKIAQFVLKLQQQTTIPHWSLVGENIIYASALGQKPVLGPRSNWLYKIIKLSNICHFAGIMVGLVGLAQAIKIWCFVKRESISTTQWSDCNKIFVGFGASSEEAIFHGNFGTDPTVLRINESSNSGAGLLGCPGFWHLMILVLKLAYDYTAKLKTSDNEIFLNKVNCLTTAATNLGTYAFYKLYWRMVKTAGLQEVTFIVPAICAFACVDEKEIKTSFIQHGLLSFVIMPIFSRIELLTEYEQNYYRSFLPKANISIKKHNYQDNKKNKVIMLLSVNVRSDERIPEALSIVQWAKESGFIIVVRPTPAVTSEQLEQLRLKLPEFVLDNIEISFDESIIKWAPMAVVSWTSTGLATALSYGSLPVSLYNPETGDSEWEHINPVLKDMMVYPMLKRFIFWSADREKIKSALVSIEYMIQIIDQLRATDDNLLELNVTI